MAAPRYEALVKLASGGMATVWIGTARGALGFRQLVAIKRPHPHLLDQAGFREELIAEARLASMIRHANVVDVRDVEEDEGSGISLVMDYIEGASLGELLVIASKRGLRISPRVAVRIIRDACAGLHAAHELVDEKGRPVGLVHRDVSPQNILVGEDGIARVTDFGVAKFSRKNMASTSAGSLKGKLAYMAPEYLRSEPIDRRFDVFALGIVLWESLTGQRCFRGENEPETFRRVLEVTPPALSTIVPALAPLDGIVATALEKTTGARFQNAAAMGAALEIAATEAGLIGSHTEVASTLKELAGATLAERRERVRAKLANEPSLASLAGDMVSPLADQAPPTIDQRVSAVPPTETSADLLGATVTTEGALAIAPTAAASSPSTNTAPIPRANVGETLALPATARSPGLGSDPATALTPAARPHASDFSLPQPVTASGYEIESTPRPPTKKMPIFPLILGGIALAGLAVAGGITLGRSGTPAAATSAPAASSMGAVATAVVPPPAPSVEVEPAVSTSAPPPPPIAKPVAKPVAPKPAPSASTKRPPANPYD